MSTVPSGTNSAVSWVETSTLYFLGSHQYLNRSTLHGLLSTSQCDSPVVLQRTLAYLLAQELLPTSNRPTIRLAYVGVTPFLQCTPSLGAPENCIPSQSRPVPWGTVSWVEPSTLSSSFPGFQTRSRHMGVWYYQC